MAGWIKKVKAFQFKGILVILGCFLFIGAILFAERSGLSYREKAKKLTYLDADKVVTEENAVKTLKPTCLVLTDSSQANSTMAWIQFEQIFKDMKVGTDLVDVNHESIPDDLSDYETVVVLLSDLSPLHAGIAGGADIILIPEIPYDIEKVVAAIQKRSKAGKRFTILAVAEGAISKEDALLSKKDYKKKLEDRAKKYPSVSYEIADKITQKLGSEVRITVPGHTQRGGAPCAYDRVLSTRIGAGAAEAILDGEYGIMIGIVNGKIKRVPLEECAGKLKMVSPKDQTVKAAKQIGISFGD